MWISMNEISVNKYQHFALYMLVRLLSEPCVKALMQMVIDDACSLELDSTKSTNQKGLWWIAKLTETKLTLSGPDNGYSRKAPCPLNYISTIYTTNKQGQKGQKINTYIVLQSNNFKIDRLESHTILSLGAIKPKSLDHRRMGHGFRFLLPPFLYYPPPFCKIFIKIIPFSKFS
jgi:hypothetical protein